MRSLHQPTALRRPITSFVPWTRRSITQRPSRARLTTQPIILTELSPSEPTKTRRAGRSDIITLLLGRPANNMAGQQQHESMETTLGRLSEFMERGREDRQDWKDQLTDMRQAIHGLQQSSTTANSILAELAKQNLGERVSQLENRYDHITRSLWDADRIEWIESRVKKWDGWIGGGKAFIFKIMTGLIGSSAVAAAIIAIILHFWGH